MELIRQYEEPKLLHPPLPAESLKTAYGPISVDLFWSFQDWTALLPPSAIFSSDKLQSMESLDMNNGSGQSYGYIMYETTLEFTELTATLNVSHASPHGARFPRYSCPKCDSFKLCCRLIRPFGISGSFYWMRKSWATSLITGLIRKQTF